MHFFGNHFHMQLPSFALLCQNLTTLYNVKHDNLTILMTEICTAFKRCKNMISEQDGQIWYVLTRTGIKYIVLNIDYDQQNLSAY